MSITQTLIMEHEQDDDGRPKRTGMYLLSFYLNSLNQNLILLLMLFILIMVKDLDT